jgi:hypothetical protein
VHCRSAIRPLALLALTLLVSAPSWAQRPRPDRPYRGLFGGDGADPNSDQALDMSASLSAAYDDNVLGNETLGGVDPRFQESGAYAAGSLSVDYTRHAGRADVDLTGGSTYRYYPTIQVLDGASYFESIGVTVRLAPRTTMRATESLTYTPYYGLGALTTVFGTTAAGDLAPIGYTAPLVKRAAVIEFGSTSVDYRLTSRATLTGDASYGSADYHEPQYPAFQNWAAGGMFSYRLDPNATLKLGYHFRRGTFGLYAGNEPIDSHDLDVGMDYSRPLSASRKTTVGFTTGSTIYSSFDTLAQATGGAAPPATPGTLSATDLYLRTHYTVTGTAFLNRQIGRSWNARINYSRGLQYVEAFPNPFFSDSVNAAATGFWGERSRLNFSAGYTNGSVGTVTVTPQSYVMSNGVANYQMALTRFVAMFAEYDYYHYTFDQSVVLPAGMSHSLNRNSVRVGVNLWAPLLR